MEIVLVIAIIVVSTLLLMSVAVNITLAKVVNNQKREQVPYTEFMQGLIRDLAVPKPVEYKEGTGEREAEPERFEGTRFVPDVEMDEWMENQLAGLNPEFPTSNETE